jgi:hypothetical protein
MVTTSISQKNYFVSGKYHNTKETFLQFRNNGGGRTKCPKRAY